MIAKCAQWSLLAWGPPEIFPVNLKNVWKQPAEMLETRWLSGAMSFLKKHNSKFSES